MVNRLPDHKHQKWYVWAQIAWSPGISESDRCKEGFRFIVIEVAHLGVLAVDDWLYHVSFDMAHKKAQTTLRAHHDSLLNFKIISPK